MNEILQTNKKQNNVVTNEDKLIILTDSFFKSEYWFKDIDMDEIDTKETLENCLGNCEDILNQIKNLIVDIKNRIDEI